MKNYERYVLVFDFIMTILAQGVRIGIGLWLIWMGIKYYRAN